MRLILIPIQILALIPQLVNPAEIKDSTLINSPIIEGSNNTINQTTNIHRSIIPKNQLENINRSAASLETTSSNLIHIIDYFSQINSTKAKNLGNTRLSADIERQRINTLAHANADKEYLTTALINLSEIEATHNVKSAVTSLQHATSINKDRFEARLRLIQLQLKYQFLTDAAITLKSIRSNWQLLTPAQRIEAQIYEIIRLYTAEHTNLIKESVSSLIIEFHKLPENERSAYLEDMNIALSIGLTNQYLRGESTEEFSQKLLELIKEYYVLPPNEDAVLYLFNNHGIKLTDNSIIQLISNRPLKAQSNRSGSFSIFSSTLDPSRKLAEKTEAIEDEIISTNFSAMSISARRNATSKLTSVDKIFPECEDCPISLRARAARFTIQNAIHLESREGESAYTSALDLQATLKLIEPQYKETPLLARLEAINYEMIGRTRILMSAGIAGHSLIPDSLALELATRKLDDIVKMSGGNDHLAIVRARILNSAASHYRSTGHIGLSWMYCDIMLRAISETIRKEPLISSLKDYYVTCQSERLDRLEFEVEKKSDVDKKNFRDEAINFIMFIDKHNIELSEFGRLWIDQLKTKVNELAAPRGEVSPDTKEEVVN